MYSDCNSEKMGFEQSEFRLLYREQILALRIIEMAVSDLSVPEFTHDAAVFLLDQEGFAWDMVRETELFTDAQLEDLQVRGALALLEFIPQESKRGAKLIKPRVEALLFLPYVETNKQASEDCITKQEAA